jgi:hypothetical protein
MNELSECQLPGLQRIAEGNAEFGPQPLTTRLKRSLAKPWNYYIKKNLKTITRRLSAYNTRFKSRIKPNSQSLTKTTSQGLKTGDWVRVRSREEIQETLNRWKELKGCAFLEYMDQYCGTTQRVLQVMERFLDERDYRVKKTRGIILLEGVICHGTPVFGRCDRCCHLFWREEWLEKIEAPIA